MLKYLQERSFFIQKYSKNKLYLTLIYVKINQTKNKTKDKTMSTWSCKILGSDYTLDSLEDIKDILLKELEKEGFLNENFSFHPLSELANITTPFECKAKELFSKLVNDNCSSLYTKQDDIWYMIIASILMAYGIKIPKHLKELAIHEAKEDDWAAENKERKLNMDAFIDAVNRHEEGKALIEPEEGLLQQMLNTNQKVEKKLTWF